MRFQRSNARLASSTARLASSIVALWKLPTTWLGCEGLIEVIFSGVTIFSPAMYNGYSRPNSPATFFRASSIALRFSGMEKLTNGSFENSPRWIFLSTVTMAVWPPQDVSGAIVLCAPLAGQGAIGRSQRQITRTVIRQATAFGHAVLARGHVARAFRRGSMRAISEDPSGFRGRRWRRRPR